MTYSLGWKVIMTHRPTTFGELIHRLATAEPGDVYRISPIVATAVEWDSAEEDAAADGQQQPFWVVMHSVSDDGVRLLHAGPLRANQVSIRIQAESGEVVRAIFAVAASQPKGEIYETLAQFHRVGLDAGKLS
ncbi:MAG TPA: hypothetical protein VNH11_19185 [Pirellulales bacterium]|nr:hypothetical protein [Pirellulales bacterium]